MRAVQCASNGCASNEYEEQEESEKKMGNQIKF